MSENGDGAEKATGEPCTETHQYRDHTRTHLRVPLRVEVPGAVVEEIVALQVDGDRQDELPEFELEEFDLEDELWDRLELDVEWVLATGAE